MADQTNSSSAPEGSTTPDELNLVDSAVDKPRLKRRKLNGRANSTESTQAPLTSSASEPEPMPDAPRPGYRQPEPVRAEMRPAGAAIPAAKPAAGNPYAPSAQSLPTTPLYYTSGVPKQKENAMKPNSTTASTPVANSSAAAASRPAASATPAPSSAQSRPAVTTSPAGTSTPNPAYRPATASTSSSQAQARPAASAGSASPAQARPASSATSASSSSTQARPASNAASSSSQAKSAASASPGTALSTTVSSPGKASSVNDYRANVERQSREQKSVGGMISMIVYALAALFILGGFLAGYGAYVISKQIHQQSVTVSELDSRYTAQNQALTAQLKATNDSLTEALTQTQTQLARQEGLLVHQQDSLNRIIAISNDNTAAWRQERQSRAAETASLRVRLRDLEDQPRLLHP